jgi:integrase
LIQRWAGDISDKNTPGSSPEWRRLAVRTREDYRRYLLELRKTFGPHPLDALTPRVVHAFKRKLSDPVTGLLSRSNLYRIKVLQALLAYAVSIGELATNPAARMRLIGIPPRRAYWTDAHVEQFLAANPPPSIRLALMLGLWTGQRQADILHLRWSDITDGWITLERRKGRRPGRPAKRVTIPIGEALRAELARAEHVAPEVLIAESTGRPYLVDFFQRAWRAATIRAGLDGLQFLDLRRSAVVRLATAGCSVGEIASFTGHSIADTQSILDVYFVPTREAAASALAKLERAAK